jgi:probable F420-dependent oxidoreductase
MKFGITIPHYHQFPSKKAITEVAQKAEELNFDSIWVTDHIGIPKPYIARFGEVFYEPLMVLSYLTAITHRIPLGTSVVILPYRNPLFLAKAIATADQLSDGRIICGFGVGWCKEEFDALGVPFEKRGSLSNESLQILKEIWTQEDPKFQGKYFRFSDIKFLPRPVQKPHPPIWIGGKSEGALRRAAEFGDVWHPTFLTPPEAKQMVQQFREIASKKGREAEKIPVALRAQLQIHRKPEPHSGKYPLVGPTSQIIENIHKYQEAGINYLVLDLFYGIPELASETLDSMLETMEQLAEIKSHL